MQDETHVPKVSLHPHFQNQHLYALECLIESNWNSL